MSGDRFRLAVPDDLDLACVLESHGFHELAPFRWDQEEGAFHLALPDGAGGAVAIAVRSGQPGQLRVQAAAALDREQRKAVRRALRRHLACEVPLEALHAPLLGDERLAWVARAGHGRFLRGRDLFEDLARILLTTNCSWGFTKKACQHLVTHYGARGDAGVRAFPEASAVARSRPTTLRNRLRIGYRDQALAALARAGASGELAALEAQGDPERLLAAVAEMPGFGPYAVACLGLLIGHAPRVVVDSWMIGRARRHYGSGTTPQSLKARYEHLGPAAGLAAWHDLSREPNAEG